MRSGEESVQNVRIARRLNGRAGGQRQVETGQKRGSAHAAREGERRRGGGRETSGKHGWRVGRVKVGLEPDVGEGQKDAKEKPSTPRRLGSDGARFPDEKLKTADPNRSA